VFERYEVGSGDDWMFQGEAAEPAGIGCGLFCGECGEPFRAPRGGGPEPECVKVLLVSLGLEWAHSSKATSRSQRVKQKERCGDSLPSPHLSSFPGLELISKPFLRVIAGAPPGALYILMRAIPKGSETRLEMPASLSRCDDVTVLTNKLLKDTFVVVR